MAQPNLTTWTEVDPAGNFTVTSDTVTYSDMKNGITASVHSTLGLADFISTVKHNTSIDTDVFRIIYVASDSTGSYQDQTELIGYRVFGFQLQMLYDAGGSIEGDYTISPNTDYWTTLETSGTTATMKTYTDASLSTLVNTQTQTITSRSYANQAVLMSNSGGSTTTTSSGIVNLIDVSDTSNSITLTSQSFPIQANKTTGLGSLTIAGTYVGSPSSIEYQWNGGTWTTLDASPTGGTYSEVVTGLSAGQGLNVRFSDLTDVTASDSLATIGEIFLIQGDSLQQGRADNPQIYSSTDGYTALMWRETSVAWAELTDPTDSGTTDGSSWPNLATLIMNNTSRPVAFITAGDGGATLSTTPFDWKKGGASYEESVTVLAASSVSDYRAILMMVGTNDVTTLPDSATFQTDISQMHDDFVADTGISVPMVLGHAPYLVDTYKTGVGYVRLAEQNRWDNDSDLLWSIPFYDIDLSIGSDGVHFKTDAQVQLYAERWWHSINSHFFSGTDGRAPQFISAVPQDTDKCVVSFTVANSPLKDASVNGWEATDDSGTLTVLSAVIQNNTEVLLTFNRALSTNPKISYGNGIDAAGELFGDSSTTPRLNPVNSGVPVEVFINENIEEPAPQPTVNITSPTSDPTYPTASATIDLAGTTSISGGTVDSVGVTNDRGGGPYTATGTVSWSQAGITLFSGVNVLTATATSDLGETASDILTVTYTPPTTGFINLTANWPAGATVTIDGTEYTSNTLIEKAAGSYPCIPNTVEGYTTPDSQVATVTVGNTTNISFIWVSDTIRKASNFRTLTVTTGH